MFTISYPMCAHGIINNYSMSTHSRLQIANEERSAELAIITSYYPTAFRRGQITPKTSTNITRYLYSRGPVRQVFSQLASDELD